jgi:hypothetical protein
MKATLTAMCLAVMLTAVEAAAEAAPDCDALTEMLSTLDGYDVTVPPAAAQDGWCVLDRATFRSGVPGWPDLTTERLRLRQSGTEFELDLKGLRAAPGPSDSEIDDRLRSLMRLQSADLRLKAVQDPVAGVLSLSGVRLDLSGGSAVELEADIRGADLSPATLALGAVTWVRLDWRNDGKLLRPVLDLAGERMAGQPGGAAVDAARAALADLVEALPGSVVDDASREALRAAVRALPQGRGKLTLTFQSESGVGAARLAVASLSADLASPEALAAILSDARITAAWQPGLMP